MYYSYDKKFLLRNVHRILSSYFSLGSNHKQLLSGGYSAKKLVNLWPDESPEASVDADELFPGVREDTNYSVANFYVS